MHHVLSRARPRRGGFTLVEMIVAFTILAVLGVMFTNILLSQSEFTDQQNALRGARMVSRQAMGVLESELRAVQDSLGIDSASANGKTIRVLVPFRFGINCGVAGGATVVSTLPVDSLMAEQATYKGFAWRSGKGVYTVVYPTAPQGADKPKASANAVQCTGNGAGQAQVKTLTLNGRTGVVFDLTPAQATAPQGQAVFLFQRISYTFKASTAFPGRYGLFRTVDGGTSEELMAPFDSSSRFKYWTRSATASVSAPPALALIRGVDIVFVGESSYTPIGRTEPSQASVTRSIFFRNVRPY